MNHSGVRTAGISLYFLSRVRRNSLNFPIPEERSRLAIGVDTISLMKSISFFAFSLSPLASMTRDSHDGNVRI